MTTVCEIREVADMAQLRAWAEVMGVPVERRGTTLEGHPIHTATCGVTTRVCVTPLPGPRLAPAVWRSPFERM